MRVAEHHHVRRLGAQAFRDARRAHPGPDDVVQQKFLSAQRHHLRLANGQRFVGVAGHGGDGSDLFQFGEDPGQADIAGVQNVLHAVKDLFDGGIEVIVCV